MSRICKRPVLAVFCQHLLISFFRTDQLWTGLHMMTQTRLEDISLDTHVMRGQTSWQGLCVRPKAARACARMCIAGLPAQVGAQVEAPMRTVNFPVVAIVDAIFPIATPDAATVNFAYPRIPPCSTSNCWSCASLNCSSGPPAPGPLPGMSTVAPAPSRLVARCGMSRARRRRLRGHLQACAV